MTSIFLDHFHALLSTPEDVEQLNRTILQLAIQGKLTHREAGDKSAKELLSYIRTKRENLGKAKSIQDIDQSEYPFDIPDSWEWVRLGDLVKKIGAGSTPKGGKEVYTDSGTKFIRSQNVWNEGLYLDDVAFISDAINEKMSGTVVEAKDLLLNITGASIARCALVPDDFDSGNVNQHVVIIRLVEPEIRRFIHIYMTSPYVYNLIMSVQVGMSREGLSIGKLEKFVLPLPPLAEQQRIVARVEELFVQTRALAKELAHSQMELDGLNQSALSHLLASETPEEFNQHWDFIAEHFDLLFQTPEHVAPLRQSILELAVRGKLTRRAAGDESAGELLKCIRDEKAKLIEEGNLKKEKPLPPIEDDEKNFKLPKGWEWVRLGDISKSSDYGTSEKASEVDKVPILRMNNIQSGRVLLENLKYVPASLEELPKLYLKNGDLLFNRTNSYELVGKTGIFKGEDDTYTFASYLIRVSFFQEFVNIDYINSYFNSDACRLTQIEPHITQQTGQANFNGTKLKNIVIPLPPLAEQERIVKRVEQLLSLCDALKARLQSAEEERGRLVRAVMSTVGVGE